MTLQEAVNFATDKLTNICQTAKLDAQLLVCHACKIDRTIVFAHPEHTLSPQQQTLFNSILTRRNKGEPLAYITGEKEFWSLLFFVNEHVLIPRPETELLVEKALELISTKKSPRILELGTGSGAIAIAIKKERNDCEVFASDNSVEALDVAKRNADRHGTKITFIQSNWYENLRRMKFDLIVCNPPYIAQDDPHLNQYVTKYEPDLAVISTKDGLQDVEIVISKAKPFLEDTGYLLIEHGFEQKLTIQKIFIENNFKCIQSLQDLNSLDRVTYGRFE